MRRTLVYGMHWKSQSEAIRDLEKRGLISVEFWIGKNRENDIHIGKLRRVNFEKDRFSGLNRDIYDEIYKESFCTFLDMLPRNPSLYNITHQEAINIYNYLFDYFSNLLHKKKIELIIFHMLPHFGSDYLLVQIAKKMGIETLLFYQSLIPNRFFYVRDLDDFGDFKTSSVQFAYPKQKIELNTRRVQFYMKSIKLKYRSCNFLLFQRFRRYIFRSLGKMTLLGLIKSYIDCLKFKYHYNQMAKSVVDFNREYIYFPLQLQPELTTSTLGGIYSDQILAIERLRTLIPDNWYIYVKENPKQLEGHRGDYFFKRLSLIPNLKYIAKDVNSFDLIENSQFVATITGTVGWEALQHKKACVVFGKAWYQNFHGVFKYSFDLKLKDILNMEIDIKRVEEDYNKLILKSANGIVDRGYIVNYKEYSDDRNREFLIDSLERIILSLD
jgi:capsule polysaccharide modification protein KpsS